MTDHMKQRLDAHLTNVFTYEDEFNGFVVCGNISGVRLRVSRNSIEEAVDLACDLASTVALFNLGRTPVLSI